MFKSGSTKLVRSLNEEHILNLIRITPGISARDISKETNLQMSTVLYTIKSLQKKDFVKLEGFGETTLVGGKPPKKWALNEKYGYFIGGELLSKEFRTVVIDFSGNKVFSEIYKLQNKDNILYSISEVVRKIMKSLKINEEKVIGMGIGIPGAIDNEKGIVVRSKNLGFENYPLVKMLNDQFSFPIEIDNDANAGALGVKWLNSKQFLTPNIIFVSIHKEFSGMGIGFIVNHEIYRGAHFSAGELANFISDDDYQRIFLQLKTKFGFESDNRLENRSGLDFNLFLDYANNREETGLFLFAEIAKIIARHLAHLINLFNPNVVVIGGDMCEAEKYMEKELMINIENEIISDEAKNIEVIFSENGKFTGAVGGASLVLKNAFR